MSIVFLLATIFELDSVIVATGSLDIAFKSISAVLYKPIKENTMLERITNRYTFKLLRINSKVKCFK